MKYSLSTVALLAFAGMAAAEIPACATKCLSDAVASSTTCGASDVKCQCEASNVAAIQGASTSCVISACGDKALDVLAAATADCEAVNSAPASSSVESTLVAATTLAESTSTSVSTSTPILTPTSSAPASISVSPSVPFNSTSVVAVPTTSANTTVTTAATTSTAPTEVPAGAGTQLNVGTGGLFIFAVAALAVL
ncbi:hypothetical protein BUE80_DR000411 [Diplocarpon rosae]|nr:hypothetical protein BUE80_DR000411 [Diplocarpon rosae]